MKLICGDCANILDMIPDASVDGVVTDPPFGINFKYDLHKDSDRGYIDWLWPIIEKCERKCRPGSPMFVWQATPNIKKLVEWFPRDWRMFISAKNFVQIRKIIMQYSYDPILAWWIPGEKPYSAEKLSRDFFVSNTSPSAFTGINKAWGHPCPRPLDVCKRIVEEWIRPGGTVLDPFMGSGTVGVAAKISNRHFIGIDISNAYVQTAKYRIDGVIVESNYTEKLF